MAEHGKLYAKDVPVRAAACLLQTIAALLTAVRFPQDTEGRGLRQAVLAGRLLSRGAGVPPDRMSVRIDDGDITTAVLIERCAEETKRFLRRAPYTDRFCFALFRRALVAREDQAWAGIYTCYDPLVRSWASRMTTTTVVEDLAARAYERLWSAVDEEKFARFADLSALLGYFKLCVRAVILDDRRAAARRSIEVALDGDPEGDDDAGTGVAPLTVLAAADDVEGETLDRDARQQFWQTLHAALPDQREAVLVRLSFIEQMPPRDICLHAPSYFATIDDVYRIKRNVLARLRRDPVVRELAARSMMTRTARTNDGA